MNLKNLIASQLERRRKYSPNVGFKINLYKNYEVAALADAIGMLKIEGLRPPVESIMVGDSYFTTHMGRSSTKLTTIEEKEKGLNVIASLIKEVRIAIDEHFPKNKPYLVGDMPDGAVQSQEIAVKSAKQLLNAGADVIKVEVNSEEDLNSLNVLCLQGVNVMAHIGYTPQKSQLRRYGQTLPEALTIYSLVNKLNSYDILSVVLEMVDQSINELLCEKSRQMQIYSIFSGKAKYGGQSLNIWDACFKPGFDNKYFPPTADMDRTEYPSKYTREAIKLRIYELMKLAINADFPKCPPSQFSEEEKAWLKTLNPFTKTYPKVECYPVQLTTGSEV